jgi:hypothetical protein
MIDRFAQIEAEFKAIKKLYEAAKADVLSACLNAAGEDMKAHLDGDLFSVDFSLTAVNQFSAERAKAFLTEDQIAQCYTQSTRQNLNTSPKVNVRFMS